jgi:Planctomycete cytochrome C
MKIDKIYLSLALLIILATFSWFTSCTHVANIANIPEVCFTGDVLPIFVNNCAKTGCHSGGGRESRMTLNNYSDIIQGIVPGNPNSSSIYQAIIAKWGNGMPPNQPLSEQNRTIIRVWIEQGAGQTVCTDTSGTSGSGNTGGTGRTVCDTINPVTFSGAVWPIVQTSCTGCHSGSTPGGRILLASYADVQTAASNGSLINSLLGNGITKMPKGGSLSTCQIREFEIWVNNGSLNN